ncbi:MAG TPA: response regulator [Burkholderiales bacterium]|nr:response regulator [Burkholderiales bacterium]
MSERTVYVVDDDEAVRDALGMLLRTAGLRVETYASANEFLEHARPSPPACIVLDIRMPGMSGTALQERLAGRAERLPILFVTGHGDVPMAVEAMKKGAYDFIEKPFDDRRLLRQVLDALEERPAGVRPSPATSERLAHLSAREREVLERVLAGRSSREIAAALAISVKTVEFHRARIMQKLGVRSAAELFRACLAGG